MRKGNQKDRRYVEARLAEIHSSHPSPHARPLRPDTKKPRTSYVCAVCGVPKNRMIHAVGMYAGAHRFLPVRVQSA